VNVETLRAAVGKRATIRLRDSTGGFHDIVGVLQSETSLINRRGELIEFAMGDIAFFRIIPVFNRRDASSGQLHIYDTLTRDVQEIVSRDGFISIYCCGPTVYRDADDDRR